jgi:hypothetical protein
MELPLAAIFTAQEKSALFGDQQKTSFDRSVTVLGGKK